jgi:hypothetical protein
MNFCEEPGSQDYYEVCGFMMVGLFEGLMAKWLHC